MDLLFEYELNSARFYILLHFLVITVLILPKLTDKYQWATLFTLFCIPNLCAIYFYEAEVIPGYYDNISLLGIIGATTIFVRWIIFGLATYKNEAQTPLFKFFMGLNDKIQHFFDKHNKRAKRKKQRKLTAVKIVGWAGLVTMLILVLLPHQLLDENSFMVWTLKYSLPASLLLGLLSATVLRRWIKKQDEKPLVVFIAGSLLIVANAFGLLRFLNGYLDQSHRKIYETMVMQKEFRSGYRSGPHYYLHVKRSNPTMKEYRIGSEPFGRFGRYS